MPRVKKSLVEAKKEFVDVTVKLKFLYSDYFSYLYFINWLKRKAHDESIEFKPSIPSKVYMNTPISVYATQPILDALDSARFSLIQSFNRENLVERINEVIKERIEVAERAEIELENYEKKPFAGVINILWTDFDDVDHSGEIFAQKAAAPKTNEVQE